MKIDFWSLLFQFQKFWLSKKIKIIHRIPATVLFSRAQCLRSKVIIFVLINENLCSPKIEAKSTTKVVIIKPIIQPFRYPESLLAALIYYFSKLDFWPFSPMCTPSNSLERLWINYENRLSTTFVAKLPRQYSATNDFCSMIFFVSLTPEYVQMVMNGSLNFD